VRRGTLLAVVESRELAHLRSAYIEALHHEKLADATAEREQSLWDEGITSEEDYMRAMHGREEARIMLQVVRQELGAVDVDFARLDPADTGADAGADAGADDGAELHRADPDAMQNGRALTRYEIRAPIDGSIMALPGVLGATVEAGAELFDIARLDVVRAVVQVPASDLSSLAIGDHARLRALDAGQQAQGVLALVGAQVDPLTQLAKAWLEVPNPDGVWRPGLFVSVEAQTDRRTLPLCVPAVAVQEVRGQRIVFVADEGGAAGPSSAATRGGSRWIARRVEVGASADAHCSIESGLTEGERVAVSHLLLLKSTWLLAGGLGE
jgi:cobalt-zinc-cadmium efflux system membrane fusion protein